MPREKDHLSVHRYNGMVTSVRRAEPSSSGSSRPPTSKSSEGVRAAILAEAAGPPTDDSGQSSHELPPSRRGRKGFTVHWPFQTQSIATDTLSIFTSNAPALFRRATWNPPKPDDLDSTVTSPRDSTLIPDYVVNFIRGETPETVARRKQNGGARGMRTVDITHQHRPQRSHMAVLEGEGGGRAFLRGQPQHHDDGDAHSQTTGTSTTTELQQILPGDEKSRKGGWRELTSGWKCGLLMNLVLIVVVLTAGFVCLVVAEMKIALTLGDMSLFTGSCSTARNLDWGLHALINAAVVVLMVGANYVFQVLSSPTRSEIAAAHESKKWLEIGVPSVRNFRHIAKGRAVLALLLLAVAVATQIIYNSIIFVSETGFDYDLIVVQSSFLTGSQFSNSTENNNANLTRDALLDLQSLAGSQNALTNLSTPACIDIFSAVFNRDYQNILLVLNNDDSSSSNSLVATFRRGLDASALSDPSTSTTASQVLVDGSAVSYCLAQPAPSTHETCTVDLDATLFVAVLALHLVALAATATALLLLLQRRRFAPLVTLGDAIASFLRDPDPATRANALLTKANLAAGLGAWGFTDGKYWAPPAHPPRYLRTASRTQALTAGGWLVATVALVAGALAVALSGSSSSSSSLSGFGVASASATFLVETVPVAAVLSVVAAVPQGLLAGLYWSVNGLLTAWALTRESAGYAIGVGGVAWRPLRVSAAPVGMQTTSLYLTLPRPVSWALAGWFAAMGFVLSQACFVVVMSGSGESTPVRGVGLSGVALVVLLGMLGVLGAVVAGLGCVPVRSAVMADGRAVGNPLALEGGSCSAVVSARCHGVPGETDAWWGKVAWGVVDIGHGGSPRESEGVPRHVTYSTREVGELNGCHRYV